MGENRRPIQQTREQERAAQAWADVSGISAGIAEAYSTQVRRLSSLIQVNGLGQTLAFLRSKSDSKMMQGRAVQALYDQLSKWVMGRMGKRGDLLSAITRWDSDAYRRATTEALAYALWLRRFAEAKAWEDRGAESS